VLEIPMGKIAIISDIHGNLLALETVLKDISKRRNVEEILCLGDVVGYYPYPNECIDLVRENCSITIMGNHEAGVLGVEPAYYFNTVAYTMIIWTKKKLTEKNADWIASLPKRRIIERKNKSIYLVHGSPFKPFDYFDYVDNNYYRKQLEKAFEKTMTDVITVGHTHIPVIVKHNKNKLFINPGSVGQPRNGIPGAYYALFNPGTLKAEIIRLDYDFKPLQEKMKELEMPKILIERLDKGI